jgi:hypothetical protein
VDTAGVFVPVTLTYESLAEQLTGQEGDGTFSPEGWSSVLSEAIYLWAMCPVPGPSSGNLLPGLESGANLGERCDRTAVKCSRSPLFLAQAALF